MSEEGNQTRRTVLKTLGLAAGVGAVGTGHSVARELGGSPEQVTTDSAAELDDDAVVTDAWPQFQGNAAKTGIAGSGPVSNPSVAWRYEAGEDVRVGTPVVADDTVYVTVGQQEGDPRRDLVALTIEGEEKWRRTWDDQDSRGYSTPAFHDGTVYVGLHKKSECDVGNALLALDAESGKEQWRVEMGAERLTAPTVADDTLYCVSPATMDDDGDLYAFDTETGKVLWRYGLDATGISGYITPPVAVDEGVVYVAAADLFALDAETGAELWTADTQRLKGTGENTPTVVDGTVYVGTGGYGGTFYAVSTEDGSIEWTYQVTDDDGFEGNGRFTSATVSDGAVVVSYQGIDNTPPGCYALDAETGEERWFAQPDAVTASPVAVADAGVVYVESVALDVADGSTRWQVDGGTFGTAAVADDTVYVGGYELTAITGDTESDD